MNPRDGDTRDAYDPGATVADPDLLRSQLEGLSEHETGIGFIYAALSLLAERWHLTDVVIVLENETFGSQMFRLGARRVGPDIIGQLGGSAGMYCWPERVPASEREAIYLSCQDAFTMHLVRFSAAHDQYGASTGATNSSEHVIVPEGPSAFPRQGVVDTNQRSDVPRSHARRRELVTRLLLLVDIVIFLLTIADVHGTLRYALGLTLGTTVPGWSVVGPLKLNNPALELSLTISASLALIMITAQIFITIGEWHPVVIEELTCLVCLPSLLLQSHLRGWPR